MALQVITSDMIGAATQVTLGTADDVIIVAGVTVASTGAVGISNSGSDQSVNVQGTVVGATRAIDLGAGGLTSTGQHLTVGAPGYVGTASVADAAVLMRGFDHQVDNAGTIHGEYAGIEMRGGASTSANTSTINNTGLIEALEYAIFRDNSATGGDQNIVLNNTGEVRGTGPAGYAYYSFAHTASDTVNNSGLMVGDVQLGAGVDFYYGSLGRVVGDVLGGSGDDDLFGGDFGDRLFGGSEYDWLKGGGGDDFLDGGTGADDIEGGDGDDDLIGSDGADSLSGGDGDDFLDGGNDGDTLWGDAGNDVIVAGAGAGNDFVFGGDGDDEIYSGADDDVLTGDAGNDLLDGGVGKDTISGGAGDDNLLGRADDDTMNGDAGNDLLDGALGKDVIEGGDGDDQVLAGADDDTVKGDAGNDKIEGGASKDTLSGGAGNDDIKGDADDDKLRGDAGNDTLNGGGGNDIFVVDNLADLVIDVGGGIDLVLSAFDFNLASPADAQGSVEQLALTGSGSINGTGNALANTVTGNIGNNTLRAGAANDTVLGGNGNDRLFGEAGNDVLNGGAGIDKLYGWLGKDIMTGGTQADQFVFDTKPTGLLNRDTITDFQHGVDKLLIENAVFKGIGAGGLKADFFHAGTAAHDATDRIVYNKATGALSYDADGTGALAAVQFAMLANKAVLTASDFLVI